MPAALTAVGDCGDRRWMDWIAGGAGRADARAGGVVFCSRDASSRRRAGAEDLITLLTNGHMVPSPPKGETLEENYSVSVAMEYRGHWVRVSRPQASVPVLNECRKQFDARAGLAERLDGSYPYECVSGKLTAHHVEIGLNGKRLFYGKSAGPIFIAAFGRGRCRAQFDRMGNVFDKS